MANTSTLPWFLTTKPPKASSPGALSPPPSAMMNAEFGLVGASNLIASPSFSWLSGLPIDTFKDAFFWPFGGAGQRKTRIGARPVTTVAVNRPAIHQPRKVRRVNRGDAVGSAIGPE